MRDTAPLTPEEIRRYGRHLVLPEVGIEGQERLKAASVLVVGAGGLGAPASLYLAAAGIGRLGLVEFDRVEESNLQRQILYGNSDVGRPKLEVAAERLRETNPLIELELHPGRFSKQNALELVEAYDVVVDGSDNFSTRYLVNDACVLADRPDVFGSVLRFEGQLAVFWASRGPCYRCLFPEPPPPGAVPDCAEGGVLGVLPGIIGSLQAQEALKLVLGVGQTLVGRLLLFDGLRPQFREIGLPKADDCPVCSRQPGGAELVEYAEQCAAPGAAEPDGEAPVNISALDVQRWRTAGRSVELLDVRTEREHQIARIEGARLIPFHELPGRVDELTRDADLVVFCHHGVRSASAVRFLRSRGLAKARNLAGGIDAWSLEVDPAVPRY